MSRLARHVAAALLLLLAARPASASDLSDDLAARRQRLMQRFSPDTMVVLLSAPARTYSNDVDYEYHQDSNLYYLTGITQEDTVLVLMPGNVTRRELLFIKDRNPEREHWTGRLLSREDARERTGIATVLSSGSFDAFIGGMLGQRGYATTVDEKEAAAFFAALGEGRARIAVPMDAAPPGQPPTRTQVFVQQLRDRYVGYTAIDATPALKRLRMVKTPYELTQLTRATDISAEAQMAGMHAAAPGVFEYQVKAAIEAVHRSRGAVSWAYPSIVGSGPNATILHYPEADRQMQAGDLLLVDAAANLRLPGVGHHPHLPGERHVHGRATRHLRDRPARAGGSDQGGEAGRDAHHDSQPHGRGVEGGDAEARPHHRRRRASSSPCGTRTAHRTSSGSTCTTWVAAPTS